MKINVQTEGLNVPTAFITKDRKRVKQFDNTVYLNNGDEFQLELFNPTSIKLLAKILINEESIGAGIVLRPGERVFLERYLAEAKKFLFGTYEVDGNNQAVLNAIANNGSVTVRFYKEEIPLPAYIQPVTYIHTTTWPPYTSPTWTSRGSCLSDANGMSSGQGEGYSSSVFQCSSSLGGSESMSRGIVDSYSESDMSLNNTSPKVKTFGRKMSRTIKLEASNPIETGRVEKGSNSNQSFKYDTSSFEYFWSWSTVWKILPISQKPITREDLKVFCTNCGTRRRKDSHKFCPNCGAKF